MRAHEPVVDSVAALVLLTACEALGLFVRTEAAYFPLSALLVVPLVIRRRWPVVCLALVFGAALLQWLTVRDSSGVLQADVAMPVTISAAANYGPPWAGRLGLGGGIAAAVLGGLSWPLESTTVSSHLLMGAFLASVVVAAWTIGVLNRVRRKQVQAMAERARLLEVGRDQRERLVVLAERNRIAREMHDVVAHSLAVIIAQADGGRYASSFPVARDVLGTIGDHGRQALADTRRVLGVLRDDAPARQPGAHDIPDLVDKVRAGGLDVRLTLDLPPEPVESGLSLVVYRIVQEGLTNVLKHASGATRADVVVRWGRRKLTIDVLDNGRGPASGVPGYGMIGMRERVSGYGGTVALRPHPDGGHLLTAVIPVSA